MPKFVKSAADEKKWSKAKQAAGTEGGKKGKLKEQAEHDAKCSMRKGR